jgi:poly-beta-1,6 N-acetyl-D-glucosamine synthase
MFAAFLHHLERMTGPLDTVSRPMVTILAPAYNEGPVIEASIESLMALDYPHLEALVIDDGSTDDTFGKASRLAARYGPERLRVIRKANGGKWSALNLGIQQARGELILCTDADSRLEPGTVREMIKHFDDPKVGAVAGNVKVANRLSLLTWLQALEYVEGLNLIRMAQALLRRVTVIPGPVGMFRKSMLEEIGGYKNDTYAEDCELTLRIGLAGWDIKYEGKAVAWTEAPETSSALFKQRYRWGRGILQAIIKHRRELLRPFPKTRDWLLLCSLAFESIALPTMDLLGVLFFVTAALGGGLSSLVFLWWVQLTLLDMVIAIFCVALEKEDLRLAFLALPYRLYFVPLVDCMRFFAWIDELYQVRMGWMRLERVGRI